MYRSLVLLSLAGCATDPTPPVTGPFDGAPHRFVIDSVTIPMTGSDARLFAEDLDGDGNPENVFGQAMSVLNLGGDVNPHGADMIASGTLASSVIIRSDDLQNDGKVGISFLGTDGDADVPFGGTFVDGIFASNRAASGAAGTAALHVPGFVSADPFVLDTTTLQIDLQPDQTGYVGFLRGGLVQASVMAELERSIHAMLLADPNHHLDLARTLDTNPADGVITDAEIVANGLVQSIVIADVALDHGRKMMSFGYRIHLKACASGTCEPTPPPDSCFDRVKDGDETAVDCGGSCAEHCAAAAACHVDTDCQSDSCSAAGICAAPTCTDGIVDGFESGVDCGGTACAACAVGVHCVFDLDCETTHCDGTTSTCTIYPP